jgi:hypothetical protein
MTHLLKIKEKTRICQAEQVPKYKGFLFNFKQVENQRGHYVQADLPRMTLGPRMLRRTGIQSRFRRDTSAAVR